MDTPAQSKLLQFFKALAHESRLKLLGLVAQREHSVQELAALVGLKEPTVSHHLAMLKNLGLVSQRQDANTHWYALEPDAPLLDIGHYQDRPSGLEQRRLDDERSRGGLAGLGLPNDRQIEPACHAAEQLGRTRPGRGQPSRLCRDPGALDRFLEFFDRGLRDGSAAEAVAEDVEEADGIGAAGDGDGDAIAGREHAMALDGMDDAVEQDDFIVGPDTIKQTHGQDDPGL